MTEQMIKKKKRKDLFLLVGYDSLSNDEAIRTLAEIRRSLLKIFKYHIGKANAISTPELFEKLLGVNPVNLSIYIREYWWNVIKKVISSMRKDETLFIINERVALYVLQTQAEADKFKTQIDRNISNLNNVKTLADKWVTEKRWQTFLQGDSNEV